MCIRTQILLVVISTKMQARELSVQKRKHVGHGTVRNNVISHKQLYLFHLNLSEM